MTTRTSIITPTNLSGNRLTFLEETAKSVIQQGEVEWYVSINNQQNNTKRRLHNKSKITKPRKNETSFPRPLKHQTNIK